MWVWGQFLDHNFELAEGGSEEMPISVNQNDPLESFSDTLGMIPFDRDAPAPGSGTSARNPRQQINTVPSYIDGYAIYGGTQSAAGMAAHRTRTTAIPKKPARR